MGDALRKHRKKAGLSQELLAERADLSSKYVSEVERGNKTISVDALARIAKAMSVRLRELFKEL